MVDAVQRLHTHRSRGRKTKQKKEATILAASSTPPPIASIARIAEPPALRRETIFIIPVRVCMSFTRAVPRWIAATPFFMQFYAVLPPVYPVHHVHHVLFARYCSLCMGEII